MKTLAIGRVIKALPVDDRALEPTSVPSGGLRPCPGPWGRSTGGCRSQALVWRLGKWDRTVGARDALRAREGPRLTGCPSGSHGRSVDEQTWVCILALTLLCGATSGNFLILRAAGAGEWGQQHPPHYVMRTEELGRVSTLSAVEYFSCCPRLLCLEAKADSGNTWAWGLLTWNDYLAGNCPEGTILVGLHI